MKCFRSAAFIFSTYIEWFVNKISSVQEFFFTNNRSQNVFIKILNKNDCNLFVMANVDNPRFGRANKPNEATLS
jgi:hypothetical protein